METKNMNLELLEFNVVGHCNLNCKGCLHFSNIVEKPIFESVDEYEKDLLRLKELSIAIKKIRFLGGEPLLCNNLNEFIDVTKKIFPNTTISICSNGILITQISEKVLQSIKKNNVEIEISLYDYNKKHYKKIKEFLKNNEIIFSFFINKSKFRKQLNNTKNQNIEKTLRKCIGKNCTTLLHGKLAKCPITMYIDRLNKKFDCKFPSNECIDIYDKNITGEKILNFLNKPIELCSYCTNKAVTYKWKANWKDNATLEDWVISDTDKSDKIYYMKHKLSNRLYRHLNQQRRNNHNGKSK